MPDSDIIFSNSFDKHKSLALVFKKDMFVCQDFVLLDFCFSGYFYFASFRQ